MQCRRCGRCCINAGCFLQVTPGDLKRWQREGREDILSHISTTARSYSNVWRDPATGEKLDCCPFLRKTARDKYECTIHETRPQPCTEFFCILCEEDPQPQPGEEVVFGLWDFIVSDAPDCPKCGKHAICQAHHFINLNWLQHKIRYYGKRI